MVLLVQHNLSFVFGCERKIAVRLGLDSKLRPCATAHKWNGFNISETFSGLEIKKLRFPIGVQLPVRRLHRTWPTSCSIRDMRTSFPVIPVVILSFCTVTWGRPATQMEPKRIDFCEVVAFPANFYGQALSIDVILWPSEHVLTLFGEACVPKEGYDVTTQAILPANWPSLPKGKKLEGMLKWQKPAKVEVVGIFESREQQYGLDATRFRFSISQINSVSNYQPTSLLQQKKSNRTTTIVEPWGYKAAHNEPDPQIRSESLGLPGICRRRRSGVSFYRLLAIPLGKDER
jgi:hypothetical protein